MAWLSLDVGPPVGDADAGGNDARPALQGLLHRRGATGAVHARYFQLELLLGGGGG